MQKSTLPAMAHKQQNSNAASRNPQQQQQPHQQQQQQPTASSEATIFDRLDVIETSFHLIISRSVCDALLLLLGKSTVEAEIRNGKMSSLTAEKLKNASYLTAQFLKNRSCVRKKSIA